MAAWWLGRLRRQWRLDRCLGREIAAIEEPPQNWTRVNLDSGASVTALPSHMATRFGKAGDTAYSTADGSIVEDKGAGTLRGWDERGCERCMSGRLCDVRKILASAGKMAQNGGQDFYLGYDGGFIFSRTSPLGRELRRLINECYEMWHRDTIPVYLERGVFNFYLRDAAIDTLDALEEATTMSASSSSGLPPPSGNEEGQARP